MKISVQIILFTVGKDDQEMRLFFKPPLTPLYLLSTIITIRYCLADMGVALHTLLHDMHFREVWDNIDLVFLKGIFKGKRERATSDFGGKEGSHLNAPNSN